MVEVDILKRASADDDEIAACIAAISCLLAEEEAERAAGQLTSPAVSRWRAAARLEGTGRARYISDTSQMKPSGGSVKWSHQTKLLIAFAVTSLFGVNGTALDVGAQNAVAPVQLRPPIAVRSSAGTAGTTAVSDTVPPTAPDVVRAPVQAPNVVQVPVQAPDVVQAPVQAAESIGLGNTAFSGPRMIRVLIGSATGAGDFKLPDGAVLKDVLTGDTMAQLPPQSRWNVLLRGDGTFPQLSFNGTMGSARHTKVLLATNSEYRRVAFVSGVVPKAPDMVAIPPDVAPSFWLPAARAQARSRSYILIPPQEGIVGFGGHFYRGAMIIQPNANGAFSVINYVELEDYLQSVVPSEMPSRWPMEALKAQAIAARSYAVSNMGKHESVGYDVKANTEDQVYTGIGSENAATNLAIGHTRGTVLRQQGQVITAYFHSASGGWTELSENVWSKPLPYLRAMPDYDDQSPYFSWTRRFNTQQAEQILQKSGKSVGTLLSLMPICRGVSPHVRWLMAVGSDRSILISGEDARRLFSLPSTCFNVGGSKDSYAFAGRGFGHGLGMSQWGAKHLAEIGFNSNDILNYYYKDVTIERL